MLKCVALLHHMCELAIYMTVELLKECADGRFHWDALSRQQCLLSAFRRVADIECVGYICLACVSSNGDAKAFHDMWRNVPYKYNSNRYACDVARGILFAFKSSPQWFPDVCRRKLTTDTEEEDDDDSEDEEIAKFVVKALVRYMKKHAARQDRKDALELLRVVLPILARDTLKGFVDDYWEETGLDDVLCILVKELHDKFATVDNMNLS